MDLRNLTLEDVAAAGGITPLTQPPVEPALAKTIAFTDEHGNRFIFPSWIIYSDDPDAPSATSLWWKATAICSRLHNAKHEWFEFNPESFPHVRGHAASPIFEHGAATTLLFAGPDFDKIAAEAESR